MFTRLRLLWDLWTVEEEASKMNTSQILNLVLSAMASGAAAMAAVSVTTHDWKTLVMAFGSGFVAGAVGHIRQSPKV